MKIEQLSERWYHFDRIVCKTGCIDRWTGDMLDDPNNSTHSMQKLNTNIYAFRLNGKGSWYYKEHFRSGLWISLQVYCSERSSEEIWNNFYIKQDE